MRIQHVNIMVDDLAAADVFYTEVLGLERAATPDLGFPAQFYAFAGDQELHVNELSDRRPERAHICLRVGSFDEVYGRMRAHGVLEIETWGKVRRLPTGTMQMFVRDPSGNLIELASEPGDPIDPAIFGHDEVQSDEGFFDAEGLT
jgi:catechol 2,3-dioxygenase-like lactoylglutathione lyase family enzyme